jgi:ketosteroid isomerase-like protein
LTGKPVPRERKLMSEQTNVDVQTNVAVVQEAYEAFIRGDIPAVLGSLAEDVEWTLQGPSVIPFAGTFRGPEGIAEFFTLLDETLEFEQFEPRKFVAQGDTVVVLGHERSVVKQTGRGFEQVWAHVYTLRDGKIATGLFIEDTAAQVEAAFSTG